MRKLMFEDGEQLVFDIFFAGIVSMGHCHPGAGVRRDDVDYPIGQEPAKLSIEQCADVALEMVEVRRKVLKNSEELYIKSAEQAKADYLKNKGYNLGCPGIGPTYDNPLGGLGD